MTLHIYSPLQYHSNDAPIGIPTVYSEPGNHGNTFTHTLPW